MSSLALRPPALFFKSCFSASPSSSFSSSSCSLALVSRGSNLQLNCPRKIAFREILVLRAQSFDSSSSGETGNKNDPNAADFKPTNGAFKSRKEILLEYVQNVQPEFMEVFAKRAPMQVVDAMRQTVANMIGTLPEQFFALTVTTVAENLAQLMYGVLMTGYMFRNAQYRLELQQSLEQVALPEPKEKLDAPEFAPGTQKKVTGEVIRWNNVSGPEKLDAVKYIELLEAEIQELTRQLVRKSTDESNDLMNYLKTLEPENLKELTSTAGEDVILAMNTFIKRLLAVSDPSQLKTRITETSAPELGKLLSWLMVVGYSIRNIEVRFDMERILGTPTKLAELPPGENV